MSVRRDAGQPRGTHVPALDGLRGLALLLVVLFHHGFGWARGGFVGVSVFFALSGYLVTSLLMEHHGRTGSIGYRRFLARRARRLVPALLVVVPATAIGWMALRGATSTADLHGDVVAGITASSNWWYVVDGTSYAELFREPSPLLHLWSLAVELQLYTVWPVLLLVILRAVCSGPGRVAAVSALTGLCAALTLAQPSGDLVYYGTHVRAAEFLFGAIVAAWCAAAPAAHSRMVRARRWGSRLAPWLALMAVDFASTTLGKSSPMWDRGGLSAVGALSAVMVVGALGGGAFARMLAFAPLAALGRWSYGIYLVHWPVFVFCTADRTGLSDPATFALRLAITAALTWLLAVLVEGPVRSGRLLRRPLTAGFAASGFVAVGLVIAVIAASITTSSALPLASASGASSDPVVLLNEPDPVVAAAPLPDVQALSSPADEDLSAVDQDRSPRAERSPPPTPAPTVVVFGAVAGDPGASGIGLGSNARVDDRRVVGCGLLTAARIPGAACPTADDLAATARDTGAAAVLLVLGPDDVHDAAMIANERGGDPISALSANLRVVVRSLRSEGFPVVLTVSAGIGVDDRRALDHAADDVASTDQGVVVSRAAGDGSVLATEIADVLASPLPGEAATTAPTGQRVLVLGDSTGVAVARHIHGESGAAVEAIGLAQDGCPLVDADRIRWWEGTEFDLEACPDLADVEAYVSRYRPTVLLLVASLMEQAELRVGDGDWFGPLDAEYRHRHDDYMSELVAIARSVGARILVLDSPPISSGGFAGGPMARPERIAAWNGQVAAWDQTWDEVETIAWSDALLAVEAEFGSVRPDGVHVDEQHHAELVRAVVLPPIVEPPQP